jgi:EmrB/QacA subfamily drug resistance transporter
MMISTSSAIVTNAVAPEDRGKALSFSAIAVAASTTIGPPLGGVLASVFGWGSIFFINIPIGIVGTIMALRSIPADEPKAKKEFDWAGSVLIVLALTIILLPLLLLGKADVPSEWLFAMFVTGLLFLTGFLLHESRAPEPILNLDLFRNRVFAGGNFAATLFFAAEYIMFFFIPYYLQQQHGFSASTAGLIMLPIPLAMMLAAPLGGVISDKFDSRIIAAAGLGLIAASSLFCVTFGATTPVVFILAGFIASGIGVGFFQAPNNSAVMGSVSPENRGIGGATLATMRNIGQVLGEAVAASMLSLNIDRISDKYPGQGIRELALQQTAFGDATRIICIVAACFALASLAMSLIRGNAHNGKGGKWEILSYKN